MRLPDQTSQWASRHWKMLIEEFLRDPIRSLLKRWISQCDAILHARDWPHLDRYWPGKGPPLPQLVDPPTEAEMTLRFHLYGPNDELLQTHQVAIYPLISEHLSAWAPLARVRMMGIIRGENPLLQTRLVDWIMTVWLMRENDRLIREERRRLEERVTAIEKTIAATSFVLPFNHPLRMALDRAKSVMTEETTPWYRYRAMEIELAGAESSCSKPIHLFLGEDRCACCNLARSTQ